MSIPRQDHGETVMQRDEARGRSSSRGLISEMQLLELDRAVTSS